MPKVSVIVPVYNVEQYLRRCIDSILQQSYQDFELICINDCSPDGSQEILEEYRTNYPNKVKILKNDVNLGLGKTRERGMELAQGEYLMFIDSDDYIKEDYIQVYCRHMEEKDLDVVIGGYIRDFGGKLKKHKVSDSVWSVVTYPIACAKMYKRSFLLQHNLEFSTIRCGEDIYFSMLAFYYGASYRAINYAGYYYYLNPESITGSMNYEKNHERFVSEIFSEFMGKYDLKRLPEEKYRVIEYDYIANMINALLTYGRGGGIARMKEKYAFWMQDMKEKFPGYKRNPYVGIFKPKGQTLKIRLGVGIIMGLKKIKLDKPLLYLVSVL